LRRGNSFNLAKMRLCFVPRNVRHHDDRLSKTLTLIGGNVILFGVAPSRPSDPP
jgi:hypothetical protein